MRGKREHGYWLKRTERFPNAPAAHARAGSLRLHDHTAHVQVRQGDGGYEVSYSVARWYLEDLERAGCRL